MASPQRRLRKPLVIVFLYGTLEVPEGLRDLHCTVSPLPGEIRR